MENKASATAATGGLKNDGGKLPLDLVPVDAINALASVLAFGARKYAPWNWAKGFSWSRLYAAALRHLTAFWAGEENDPESGLSHLAHALCCVAFMYVHQLRGLGTDDRHRWETKLEPEPAAKPASLDTCGCGHAFSLHGTLMTSDDQ